MTTEEGQTRSRPFDNAELLQSGRIQSFSMGQDDHSSDEDDPSEDESCLRRSARNHGTDRLHSVSSENIPSQSRALLCGSLKGLDCADAIRHSITVSQSTQQFGSTTLLSSVTLLFGGTSVQRGSGQAYSHSKSPNIATMNYLNAEQTCKPEALSMHQAGPAHAPPTRL